MIFQIWDTQTANMVGAFPTAHDAFRAVCEAAREHGQAYITTWALESEDAEGQITIIGEGFDLLDQAQKHIAA